jgi:hypothetical protein
LVPISEVALLFDHFVGADGQHRWQFEAKLFRCPQSWITSSNLVGA